MEHEEELTLDIEALKNWLARRKSADQVQTHVRH